MDIEYKLINLEQKYLDGLSAWLTLSSSAMKLTCPFKAVNPMIDTNRIKCQETCYKIFFNREQFPMTPDNHFVHCPCSITSYNKDNSFLESGIFVSIRVANELLEMKQ